MSITRAKRHSSRQLVSYAHRLSFRYPGLNQRLIGPTEEAELIKGILA